MPRPLLPIVSAVCFAAAIGLTSPAAAQAACPNADLQVTAASAPAVIDQARHAVSCLVNQERTRFGLPALHASAPLQAAAQRHNDDMLARRYFDHPDPDGRDVSDRVTAENYAWGSVAENIATGQQTPRQALDSWMRSTGHCQNILSPDNTEIGVGITFGSVPLEVNPAGSTWTQVFARPIDVAAPSADGAPAAMCPLTLGPDQSGMGDDGTLPQTAGDLAPPSRLKVVVRRTAATRVVARLDGSIVRVAGVVRRDRAGRVVVVTITRGGRSLRRTLTTAAGGDFHGSLPIPHPARHSSRGRRRRVVVTVRPAGRVAVRPSLVGGVGRVA